MGNFPANPRERYFLQRTPLLFSAPVTRNLLSGLKARKLANVPVAERRFQVWVSHKSSVPSSLLEANKLPSGLKARLVIRSLWPVNWVCRLPEGNLQTSITPSNHLQQSAHRFPFFVFHQPQEYDHEVLPLTLTETGTEDVYILAQWLRKAYNWFGHGFTSGFCSRQTDYPGFTPCFSIQVL